MTSHVTITEVGAELKKGNNTTSIKYDYSVDREFSIVHLQKLLYTECNDV